MHIGEKTLRASGIIGIFDLESNQTGKITKDFLSRAEKEGRVFMSGERFPRSFVLTEENGIYLSPVSAGVLAKR